MKLEKYLKNMEQDKNLKIPRCQFLLAQIHLIGQIVLSKDGSKGGCRIQILPEQVGGGRFQDKPKIKLYSCNNEGTSVYRKRLWALNIACKYFIASHLISSHLTLSHVISSADLNIQHLKLRRVQKDEIQKFAELRRTRSRLYEKGEWLDLISSSSDPSHLSSHLHLNYSILFLSNLMQYYSFLF